ncbi:hypothetical protein [Rhodanobacter fulvus]|uniref:hypothetical protein n=1 Tax=Rhodanobacter fulvus TaxID=219571 RepID=UPI0012EA4CC2|nr:hypothetical protein [Rhodanobacter fulvus]
MLVELKSILLSALSNWLHRPIPSIAGLSMISGGLPLMLVSKLFSIGAKVSISTPYVNGEFQVDNSNETLLFVSGLALVVLGIVLISWGTFARRPAQADAKAKLASLLQGSALQAANSEIQHHFRTAYGYSTDVEAIRAIMHSTNPDQFALDTQNAGNRVEIVGEVFRSAQGYDAKAAMKRSTSLYFVVAFLALMCFASALQPWWPAALPVTVTLILLSLALVGLCVPILSRVKQSSAVLRLIA